MTFEQVDLRAARTGHPKRRVSHLTGIAIAVAILGACSGAPALPTAGQTSPPSTAPASTPAPSTSTATMSPTSAPDVTGAPVFQLDHVDRASVLAEPEAVARLLADPARRVEGVVSLVAGLGIGIYTPEGKRVLEGSEATQSDFYLYDFEIPLLALMAADPAVPFSYFHAMLADAGYGGSASELAFGYASAFAARPESYIARLFAAMGVQADQPDLSPLQSWLLLLSAVPSNGSQPVAIAALARPGPLTAVCGGVITGSGVQPMWFVSPQPWLDDLEFRNAVDLYYALHGLMVARAINGQLAVGIPSVHEGHGGPGQSTEVAAHIEIAFLPQFVSLGGCGTLINTLRPVLGPIPGIRVDWELLPGLAERGALTPADGSFTDDNGLATTTFTAIEEASAGQGQEQSLAGHLFAFVPTHAVFASHLGITDPRLLQFLPHRYPIGGGFEITWHEVAASPSPSASLPNVPDPCTLITQEEAADAAGKEVRPGFQVPATIAGLGSGIACVFRDADVPDGEFGAAHVRIDLIDLGPGGEQRFKAAGEGMGSVAGLGDDNFYFCAETCGPTGLLVRRGQLAFSLSVLTDTGLETATAMARLVLQRLAGR